MIKLIGLYIIKKEVCNIADRKLSEETVLNNITKLGYEIFGSLNYEKNSSYISIVDNAGYKYFTRYNNLIHGKKPQPISIFNKYTYENISTFIKNKGGHLELLSSEKYEGTNQILLFRCKLCGNTFESTWENIRGKEHLSCDSCSIKLRVENRKVKKEYVCQKFREHGYDIIDYNYTSNTTAMDCEDENGYRYSKSLSSLRKINKENRKIKQVFSIRGNNKKFLIYNLNNYAKINHINVIVVRTLENQKYSTTGIECICECGNKFETNIPTFLANKTRCELCNKSISNIEYLVKMYLDEKKVSYERQKIYKDCRNVLPLPFDFYLNDFNILIEVDGQGHYHPCYFNGCSFENAEKTFKRTTYNDEIKNEYCKNKNKKLIRISYLDFHKDKYKEIINQLIVNLAN